MKKVRRFLARIHSVLLRLYDGLTAKECEVSVGDIILRRAELDHCQFLLTTRKLDVSSFVSGRNKTFPYQNTVSRVIYGTRHKEEQGNRYFTNLIVSYQAKGYDPASFLTVDNECRLIDGNHRMGVNLHMGIERMNVRFVNRRSPFSRNIDTYFKMGISSSFMEEVYDEFCNIQNWLMESGNTFCCLLKGEYEKGQTSLLKDLKLSVNVLNVHNLIKSDSKRCGVLVQFSLNFPRYCVKNGKLHSQRAEEIEYLLNLRKNKYAMDVVVQVSKNCIEGKAMWADNR